MMQGDHKPYWTRAAWAAPLAIAALIVLIITDTTLKNMSGFGVMDLQHAAGLSEAQEILAAWRNADDGVLGLIGFSTGFDYLFILFYFYVLWSGSLGARQTFTEKTPKLSWLFTLLIFFTPGAAALDALENLYSLRVVLLGHDGELPSLMTITSVKWVFAYISISYVVFSAIWVGLIARFGRSG